MLGRKKYQASDKKGNSVGLSTRIPPVVKREIERIVKDSSYLLNIGDFVREAVYDKLEKCKRDGDVDIGYSEMPQVEATKHTLKAESRRRDFDETFRMLEDNFGFFLDQGDPEEAAGLALNVWNNFEAMPDGFWKSRYLSELKKRYSDLIAKNLGVELTK